MRRMKTMSERLVLCFLAVWVARVTGDCGKPPILENGSPVDPQTSSPVGTRLNYRCFPGYVFQEGGSRHITCRENSTWSPLQAVCEPRNCGNPGEILNGYYNASDTTLGKRAYFYCNKGFNLVGKNYRLCTANGWSGQVPTCEIVQCPDPPRIANGTVSSSDGDSWPYGSIARYSCLGGYSLIGEETIVCTVTGEWDKDPPRCQVVRCNRPKVPANGKMVAGFKETYMYRDAITYECNEGFKMFGSSVIECRENSTFVPPPPTCEPINCGKPGEILNGSYNASDTTLGSKAYFYCNKGFRIVGKNYRICTTKGWDGQAPTCELVQCPDPPRIANGTVSSSESDSWPYGSIARYSCLGNYSLIGEETITCTATGEWDKDPPRCQGDCGKPPILENGSPVDPQTSSPVGTRLNYRCFPGYVFQEGGSRHITCRENSTWSPLQAVCEPRNCGNPGEILNGYYNASDTTLGKRAYFYCNKGFNLVGKNYRLCTANGWSGQVPTCEIVQCPDPPRIANGTVSSSDGDSWPYGSIARYSCLGGYSLIGEETIVCTVTGEWDKDPPRCQAPSSAPTPTAAATTTTTTPPSGGCEGHVGQQFELLFILGVSAVFLT